MKNSFSGGVLEKSAVESILCTIVSFLPFGRARAPLARLTKGRRPDKKRPAIANTTTERTRHLIRPIRERKPLGVLRYAALR